MSANPRLCKARPLPLRVACPCRLPRSPHRVRPLLSRRSRLYFPEQLSGIGAPGERQTGVQQKPWFRMQHTFPKARCTPLAYLLQGSASQPTVKQNLEPNQYWDQALGTRDPSDGIWPMGTSSAAPFSVYLALPNFLLEL